MLDETTVHYNSARKHRSIQKKTQFRAEIVDKPPCYQTVVPMALNQARAQGSGLRAQGRERKTQGLRAQDPKASLPLSGRLPGS
jgi:hypothetical protein